MIEILDFYANWCMPCKTLAPILEKVVNERNIKMTKVDIEEDTDELSLKYGIRNIPTVVVLENGNEISRFNGLKTEGDLNKFFDSLKS